MIILHTCLLACNPIHFCIGQSFETCLGTLTQHVGQWTSVTPLAECVMHAQDKQNRDPLRKIVSLSERNSEASC